MVAPGPKQPPDDLIELFFSEFVRRFGINRSPATVHLLLWQLATPSWCAGYNAGQFEKNVPYANDKRI